MTTNSNDRSADSSNLLRDQPGKVGAHHSGGIGGFSSGTGGNGNGNGGGGGGGNGGGSRGNEGVGNGVDAPPPGHDYNFNDGPGTSPGQPGAQGGNGYQSADSGNVAPLVAAGEQSGFEAPALVGIAGSWDLI